MSQQLQKDDFKQALIRKQRKGQVKSTEPKPHNHVAVIPVIPAYFPGNDCSVPLRHSGTSSAFLPSALHHLVGCLNSSVQTFSHCLLTALFRAGPAAPRCILKGPHPLHCGSYTKHCYILIEKINILSWMKNVTITAVKPVKYSTSFKIRKHRLKDHVQFWASCKKHEQTEKKAIGKLWKRSKVTEEKCQNTTEKARWKMSVVNFFIGGYL